LRKRAGFVLLIVALLVLLFGAIRSFRRDTTEQDPVFNRITDLVNEVRTASFPQLKGTEITVHGLRSDYVYLEARFTFASYFFERRLRYMVLFNADAFARGVPADGLRAIVAHELTHLDYFQNQSRMGLMGLARLASSSFTSRFERTADLQTIELGYGQGLESYRNWLYRNIPASRLEEKKRDYFSPMEIEAILHARDLNADVMRTFTRCMPMNLAEIEATAKDPAIRCSH
jgi:hypothetical protein